MAENHNNTCVQDKTQSIFLVTCLTLLEVTLFTTLTMFTLQKTHKT